ncbi:MAG: ABC transporter ATP-binding protein/permease [Agarilytica sp.]
MYRFFERLVNPFPLTRDTQAPTSLFAFCRYYARGSEIYFFAMAILTASIAILEVALFSHLGQLVDWLANASPETLFTDESKKLFITSGLILAALPIIVLFHSLIIHQTLMGNFPMIVRWSAHRFLLGQSLSFYQNEFAGRLATKVMQTALAVRETLMKSLDVLLYVSVYFSAIVILVATLDWRLAIPFVAWLCTYCLILKYFLPKLEKISTKQADARSDMTGRIVDSYTNMSTVKLFSHSRRELEYAREGMTRFLGTTYPQMRLATSLSVSIWVSNCVLAFSVAAMSIWLWSLSLISAGAIAAAIGLILRLFGMSQWIMWEVSSLFENIGTVRDGMNTLTLSRTVQDAPSAPQIKINGCDGIRFDRVSFQYEKDSNVISNFSLHIKPGERVGLVGRSGAGKSTIVNLLLRFYDVNQGNITIDKQDISTVTQESLRAHIGMVTQDTSLLHRSLRENLLYGNPNASDKALADAIHQAHAHEFIAELVDADGRQGLNARVGERGVKLSGGQRQRVAIARVLLKNAPILILDEATSALDSEVEQAIQENLNHLMKDKTVIAIAHRLSTIAALDRLIVVDKGNIIEQGSHKDLIAHGGIYAQLWKHQSGGFLGDS